MATCTGDVAGVVTGDGNRAIVSSAGASAVIVAGSGGFITEAKKRSIYHKARPT